MLEARLHHIGLARRFAGLEVIALVDGLRVRVITEDGKRIRELILDRAATTSRTARVSGTMLPRHVGTMS